MEINLQERTSMQINPAAQMLTIYPTPQTIPILTTTVITTHTISTGDASIIHKYN